MLGTMFLRLPVHAGRALVIYLHAIDTDVALPRFRITRKYERPGNKAPGIFRPALQNWKFKKRKFFATDDLFARAILDGLWKEGAKLGKLREHLDFVEQALGRLHVKESPDARGHFVDIRNLQREVYAAVAAEHVD